jgi:small subunit ribosomal protein S20
MAAPGNKGTKLHSGRHASALKRARQTLKRTRENGVKRRTIKKAIKAVRVAVAAKDGSGAQAALKAAIPVIDKGGRRGIIPRGRAARFVSRLASAVSQLQ